MEVVDDVAGAGIVVVGERDGVMSVGMEVRGAGDGVMLTTVLFGGGLSQRKGEACGVIICGRK